MCYSVDPMKFVEFMDASRRSKCLIGESNLPQIAFPETEMGIGLLCALRESFASFAVKGFKTAKPLQILTAKIAKTIGKERKGKGRIVSVQ